MTLNDKIWIGTCISVWVVGMITGWLLRNWLMNKEIVRWKAECNYLSNLVKIVNEQNTALRSNLNIERIADDYKYDDTKGPNLDDIEADNKQYPNNDQMWDEIAAIGERPEISEAHLIQLQKEEGLS